jgi:hypothetical protein
MSVQPDSTKESRVSAVAAQSALESLAQPGKDRSDDETGRTSSHVQIVWVG